MCLASGKAIWDGSKYILSFSEGVKQFYPYAKAGDVRLNGKLQNRSFAISAEDQVEYFPSVKEGHLTWELEVLLFGMSVAAKVWHEQPGHYILPSDLPAVEEFDLAEIAIWESQPASGEYWDQAKLMADLEKLKVVHGLREESWQEILAVKGVGEVVIAEASLPVPCQNAHLQDFVGELRMLSASDEETIDFFASKVKLVNEGDVLARKIPGKPGVAGKDVFGKVMAVPPLKDFQFRPKKNVRLSDDGLEVIAACAGQPVRMDEKTYMVENVYVLYQDVDLKTGSIEFSGDVYVNGNVQDGLRVFATGRLEIRGSVSRAELKAEKGARIHQSLLSGKIVVGEKYVVHSNLLNCVTELRHQLSGCLRNTAKLLKKPSKPGATNFKPGQYLKQVMEKQFPELPKLVKRVSKFVREHNNDGMVADDLFESIQIAEHFLTGLGPLEPQSLPSLLRVDKNLEQFIENMSLEMPEKLSLVVNYVQGATIACGGSFECQKGVYNSDIRADGDITIEGVCRGGKIIAGGKVSIRELGGSGVSATFVQISLDGRLLVDYCHPNVIIAVGREIIQIEEACRKLEVYRANDRVQVEKLRANPL